MDNLKNKTFIDGLRDLFGADVATDFEKAAKESAGGPAEIRQDFMDLFKVPLGSYVTPYEAVYRDERDIGGKKARGLLMGPSTVAVQAMYRRAGACLDKAEFKELPDHISTELAFMDFLCTREWEAWDRGAESDAKGAQRLEKEFLEDHIQKWVPVLCENIKKRARTPFYRGVASLLESFLAFEAKFLSGV